ARTTMVDAGGFGEAAEIPAAGTSAAGAATSPLAARGFFRSGFVCLATLFHSARSSSVSARLRRGGVGSSGIGVEERFIGPGDNIDSAGSGEPRGSLGY